MTDLLVNYANRFQMDYAMSSWLLATGNRLDSAKPFDPNPLKSKITPDFFSKRVCQSPVANSQQQSLQDLITHTNGYRAINFIANVKDNLRPLYSE